MKVNTKCSLSVGKALTSKLFTTLNILYLWYLNYFWVVFALFFFQIYKDENAEESPKEDKIICHLDLRKTKTEETFWVPLMEIFFPISSNFFVESDSAGIFLQLSLVIMTDFLYLLC